MRISTSLLVLVSAFAVGAAGARQGEIRLSGTPEERKQIDALHGQEAFELENLQWIQGGPLKLAELKGKVVLLDFTAQSSRGSNSALPRVKALAAKFGKEGLVVIGIHSSRGAENLKAYLEKNKIEHPVAIENAANSNLKRYRASGFPTFTFIGRDGKIRYADVLAESLDAAAEVLLKEPAPK